MGCPSRVYVAGGMDGLIKIGASDCPARRILAISSQEGARVTLIYETEKLIDGYRAEKLAHITLKDFRVRGEWFRVSAEDAIFAVKECAQKVGPDKNVIIGDHRPIGLKDYLVRKGISFQEFGYISGIQASTVSDICSGKKKPRMNTIIKIIAATDGDVAAHDLKRGS